MPVVNMRLSDEDKREKASPSILADTPEYPHGLKLFLDPDMVKKLGLSDPKIDKEVSIVGKAKVVAVRNENNEDDQEKFSVELQITDLGVDKDSSDEEVKDAGEILYGNS